MTHRQEDALSDMQKKPQEVKTTEDLKTALQCAAENVYRAMESEKAVCFVIYARGESGHETLNSTC